MRGGRGGGVGEVAVLCAVAGMVGEGEFMYERDECEEEGESGGVVRLSREPSSCKSSEMFKEFSGELLGGSGRGGERPRLYF